MFRKLRKFILIATLCMPIAANAEEDAAKDALVSETPVSETPVSETPREHYVSLYYLWSDIRMSTDGAWPAEHTFRMRCPAIALGNRGNGLGVAWAWSKPMFTSRAESDSLDIFATIISARLEKEYLGFLRPWVAAGLDPGFVSNKIEYNWHGEKGETTTRRFNLAYSATAGLSFILSSRFDLDFMVQWQNLGRVKNKIDYFDITGSITDFSYGAGISYKY